MENTPSFIIISLMTIMTMTTHDHQETWKTIIQVVISILTAALTAMGTTSCMGHGPF